MNCFRVLAVASGLTAAAVNTGSAGGYIPPVVVPADVPVDVQIAADEVAAVCSQRPEICAALLALLLVGLSAGGGSDAPAAVSPVDPVTPAPLPPVHPPVCVDGCPAPADPVPPYPAPVPLPAAVAGLAAALSLLCGWGLIGRWLRGGD